MINYFSFLFLEKIVFWIAIVLGGRRKKWKNMCKIKGHTNNAMTKKEEGKTKGDASKGNKKCKKHENE